MMCLDIPVLEAGVPLDDELDVVDVGTGFFQRRH
jgi:hypothetical protein